MPHDTKKQTLDRRFAAAAGILAVLLALAVPAARLALAHVGHGDEVGEFDLDSPREVSAETARHIGLKTEEVDFGTVEEILEISGVVRPHPDRHYTVSALVEGQVVRVHKKAGDPVMEGDPLVEIESLAYLEKWSGGQVLSAQIEALEAQKKTATEDLERTRKLAEGAVPKKEISLREADLAKAEAELRVAAIGKTQVEAWLRAVTPDLDLKHDPSARVTFKARAGGVATDRPVEPGQWVGAGQALLHVADYGVVQIEGELPETLIARVERRDPKLNRVRIRTPSDPEFLAEGRIEFVAPDLDPVKRTAHLIVEAENPRRVLRGEMWVDLAVVLREAKKATVVPRSAVIVDGPMHFVFLQDIGNPNIYQKKEIEPGYEDDRQIEVKSGLLPGDVVVVQGAYSLTQLRPKPAAPKPADKKPAAAP